MPSSSLAIANYKWARSIILALRSAGVQNFCFAPGFRNSPLILALTSEFSDSSFGYIDERSLAFFALGMCKSSGKATAVICTSGTAGANFFPALLEAKYSKQALILITADRPDELIDVGANQAMKQKNLFGESVLLSHTFAAPTGEASNDELAYCEFVIKKMVSRANSASPGPVHLNIQFREPLIPEPDEITSINKSFVGPKNSVRFVPQSMGTIQNCAPLLEALKKSSSPIFVVGPNSFNTDSLKELGHCLGSNNIPLLCEPSSNYVPDSQSNSVISNHDAFINQGSDFAPDLYVQIGAPSISKKLSGFLEKNSSVPFFIVDYIDENRSHIFENTSYIQTDPEQFVSQFISACKDIPANNYKPFLEKLQHASNEAFSKLQKTLCDSEAKSDFHYINEICAKLPEDSNLFIGNSMPIRILNNLELGNINKLQIFSNRGLSGIDGLISTGLGIAHSSKKPTTLVIGDISSLHDLNALSILNQMDSNIPITIYIINNLGGDIFRKVDTKSHNQQNFVMPQKVNFSALAELFDLKFKKYSSCRDFKNDRTFEGHNIIELQSSPESNAHVQGNLS